MTTWALISCTSLKAGYLRCRALELYSRSPLFCKTYRLAHTLGQSPLILSAKYGLVLPDTEIEHYNLKLDSLSLEERRAWAAQVVADMTPLLSLSDRFVCYTGDLYIQHIAPILWDMGYDVQLPLAGKRPGERQQWLDQEFNRIYMEGIRKAPTGA